MKWKPSVLTNTVKAPSKKLNRLQFVLENIRAQLLDYCKLFGQKDSSKNPKKWRLKGFLTYMRMAFFQAYSYWTSRLHNFQSKMPLLAEDNKTTRRGPRKHSSLLIVTADGPGFEILILET